LPQSKCAPAARSPVSRRRARTSLCARASSRPSLQLGVPLLRSRSLFLGARVEPSSRHSTAGVAVRGARFLLARAESSTCPRELRAEPPARRPTAEEPIVVRRCSRGAELLGLRPATLQVVLRDIGAGPAGRGRGGVGASVSAFGRRSGDPRVRFVGARRGWCCCRSAACAGVRRRAEVSRRHSALRWACGTPGTTSTASGPSRLPARRATRRRRLRWTPPTAARGRRGGGRRGGG
ncbi:hypothetical protein EMIHUDRAFT_444244, partial [Emiliania huxleyi CCMP1516]|uniref:Uncharacterized protein n=2 Tax=Emiliania huxleyi TaxID=2903 RepID=A0A0D3JG88_EMIH1